jgi:chemotaxis signal transduction protein
VTVPNSLSPAKAPVALAVATAQSTHFLPLDLVVELSDTLTVGPASKASPLQAGIVIHRDDILPLYSLDVLLGEASHGERSWEDREWGGFVIAQIGGRAAALGVARVLGVVHPLAETPCLDVPALLAPILAPLAMSRKIELPPPPASTRYLVIGAAGRRCALPMHAVERVLASCRTGRAPLAADAGARRSALVGIGSVDGRVLPAIDLGLLLGGDALGTPAGFVVTRADALRMILIADRIWGLAEIPDQALGPPPEAQPNVLAATDLGAEAGAMWILAPSPLLGTDP